MWFDRTWLRVTSGRKIRKNIFYLRCNRTPLWNEQKKETSGIKDTECRLRELLVQSLYGDAAAYDQFLKALSAHLRAYFRERLFQRSDEVEDLVQETLLAVHNQRHTYRSNQPLTAWVHAIARYKLIDLLRARASHVA